MVLFNILTHKYLSFLRFHRDLTCEALAHRIPLGNSIAKLQQGKFCLGTAREILPNDLTPNLFLN